MRVDLGRAQRLVAEQFLNRTQVRAVVQEVCREGVPQGVRADLWIQPRFFKVLVELAADRAGAETAAIFINKQRDVCVGHRLLTQRGKSLVRFEEREVVADRGHGVAAQRDDAFFLAFAADVHGLARVVQVVAVQVDQLADADASGVERLEDRAVAGTEGLAVIRGREELFNLLNGCLLYTSDAADE